MSRSQQDNYKAHKVVGMHHSQDIKCKKEIDGNHPEEAQALTYKTKTRKLLL